MGENWEEIGKLNLWKPTKEGDVLTGKVVSEMTHASFGKSWGIENAEGTFNTPSHKLLQNRLASVSIGDNVKITFDGTQPSKVRGQSPMSLYTVLRQKKN
jgi:hypothetical protein